jgi:hypothetical protein
MLLADIKFRVFIKLYIASSILNLVGKFLKIVAIRVVQFKVLKV